VEEEEKEEEEVEKEEEEKEGEDEKKKKQKRKKEITGEGDTEWSPITNGFFCANVSGTAPGHPGEIALLLQGWNLEGAVGMMSSWDFIIF